jgi:hypothetical protein
MTELKPCVTCGLYPDGTASRRVRAVLWDTTTEAEGVLLPGQMDEPRTIQLDSGELRYISKILNEVR